jgi:hypothetical protein
VRPDCPVSQRSNGFLGANDRLHRVYNDEQCRVEVSGHRTVRCNKTTRHSNGQLLRTLTVALMWRAPDSAQLLSGAPIDNRNQPTTRSGWEAINTPQPPHSPPSKPSEIFIHCKSKSPTLQDTIKAIDPLKVPKINSSALGLVRGSIVFFCCSCRLDWPFLFPFLF